MHLRPVPAVCATPGTTVTGVGVSTLVPLLPDPDEGTGRVLAVSDWFAVLVEDGDVAAVCHLVETFPLDDETVIAAAAHPELVVRLALARNSRVRRQMLDATVLVDAEVRRRVFAGASPETKARLVDVVIAELSRLPATAAGKEHASQLLGDLSGFVPRDAPGAYASTSLRQSGASRFPEPAAVEDAAATAVSPELLLALLRELARLKVYRAQTRSLAVFTSRTHPREVLGAVSGDVAATVEVLLAGRDDLGRFADDVPGLLLDVVERAVLLPPTTAPADFAQVYASRLFEHAVAHVPGRWPQAALGRLYEAHNLGVQVAFAVPLVAGLCLGAAPFAPDREWAPLLGAAPPGGRLLVDAPAASGVVPHANAQEVAEFLDECLSGARLPAPPAHVWEALLALAPASAATLAVFCKNLQVVFASAADLHDERLLAPTLALVDADAATAACRVLAADRAADGAWQHTAGFRPYLPGSLARAVQICALVDCGGPEVAPSVFWPDVATAPQAHETRELYRLLASEVSARLSSRDELLTFVGLSRQWRGTFGDLVATARAANQPPARSA